MYIPNTPNIPIMVPTDFLKQFYLEYNTLVTGCTQMKDYINQLHDFLKNKLPDSKLPDSVQKEFIINMTKFSNITQKIMFS